MLTTMWCSAFWIQRGETFGKALHLQIPPYGTRFLYRTAAAGELTTSLLGSAITKRWWELYFVRNFSFVLLLVAAFWSQGACFDSPVPAGFGAWGAPEGLPGWISTPARKANTAVGVSGFMRSGDMEEWALSAAGEWDMRYLRGAFLYNYGALDSVYRQTDAMLELSFSRWFLIAGVGAGAYAEWVPGDAAWLRYRLKAGVSTQFSKITLSVWWIGYTDEPPELPWAGAYWEPSGTFTAFVHTDWHAVDIGTLLHFKWGTVQTSYRFPGFGFTFGVSFCFYDFGAGIVHGSTGSMPDWNSAWFAKTLKK